MFIYITFDENGWITDFAKEKRDGYTRAYVLDSWYSDFLDNSDKFRYDSTRQVIESPNNLPKKSIKEIQDSFNNTLTQVDTLNKTLGETQKSLEQLQTTNDTSDAANSQVTMSLISGQLSLSDSMNDIKKMLETLTNTQKETTTDTDTTNK